MSIAHSHFTASNLFFDHKLTSASGVSSKPKCHGLVVAAGSLPGMCP